MSTLDARLTEMDRLLRDIQVELAPGRDAAPPLEPTQAPAPPPPADPPPVPHPAPERDGELQALTELAGRLLASMRELLAGYERLLAQPMAPPARRPRAIADRLGPTVSAGPFPTIEAVRAFETELSRLPGVRDVALRGYEGSDRAIIDVQLT